MPQVACKGGYGQYAWEYGSDAFGRNVKCNSHTQLGLNSGKGMVQVPCVLLVIGGI